MTNAYQEHCNANYGPEDEDQPTELDLVYGDLREAKEDAKHAKLTADARIAALTLALQEAFEYFEERYDIRDDESGPLPNEEMRLGQMIDETLYGIRF